MRFEQGKEITIAFPSEEFRKLRARARASKQSVEAFVDGIFARELGRVVRKRNDFSPGAMTAAQAKKQRRQLEREIKAQHRRSDLDKLAKLRAAIRAAKNAAKPRRVEAVELCRVGRQMAKERAKQLRIEGRAAIREAIAQEKIAAREACDARKTKAREESNSSVALARAELAEEKAFQREVKRIESSAKKRERVRTTSAERRSESDDEVRRNIPPDLVPLFESVKRQIKGSVRQSRTEAFLKYVEENESEVTGAIDREVQAEIARLQAEEAKEAKRLRRRGVSAAELASVPF